MWLTGASSGIGREVLLQLANRGVKVAASSRSAPVDLSNENITFFPLDVSDAKAVEATFNDIELKLGPVDLAIFAAGTYEPFVLGAASAETFQKVNLVNYLGVTNCLSAVVKGMMSRRKGHISWFASVAGYSGLPKAAYYGPTKAALINLAESMKLELEPYAVTISVINPGFVETPMTKINDFTMPFLMDARAAATATIAGLSKGKFEVAYPTSFVLILKFLRLLPYWLYFAVARRTRT